MDKVELAHNREIKELDWLEHLKKVNPDKIDKELFEKIFKTKTLHIRKRVDDYSVRVRVVIDIIYEKHTNTGWCHTNWWCVADSNGSITGTIKQTNYGVLVKAVIGGWYLITRPSEVTRKAVFFDTAYSKIYKVSNKLASILAL